MGTEVVSYTYDTWGKVISITGSLASTVGEKNPYLYRGYRYDRETGLYYLQARYYNPEWGRFLNADNFGGDTGSLLSHNVFAYCMNNPVNLSDPSGHFIQFLIPVAILVVRVVSVAITINSAYTACKNIYNAYQEGGASAALRQSGTEALDFTGKKFTAPLKLVKKSEKLLKDITTIGGKNLKKARNWDKVNDSYLKEKGIDAHDLKKEAIGKKAPVSRYDIYVDKDTGELFVFLKGGKGEGVPTGEFIK